VPIPEVRPWSVFCADSSKVERKEVDSQGRRIKSKREAMADRVKIFGEARSAEFLPDTIGVA